VTARTYCHGFLLALIHITTKVKDGEMRTKIASACSFILVLLASTISVTQAKNLKDVDITDEFPLQRCIDAVALVDSCSGINCNQYFPLIEGRVWELDTKNCDDCDEDEAVRVSILAGAGGTQIVDGQQTRVMEEREWVDDEITEVSRNFVNQCSYTQDVYYWGEDVCIEAGSEDALEQEPYVGHINCALIEDDDVDLGDLTWGEGAWRAGLGEPAAAPGILFPGGAFLLGARYFQEVAENAQDWATNEEMGLSVDNAGGEFEDCVLVLDRNLLEDPKSKEDGDEKFYCPDIGIVQDEDMELTSCTDGGGPCTQ
jgi:hypothetical protein